ncbi:DUF4079 domain-containing protein [Nostoc sp. FACHB-87]|uniref:DUF4079 domain-containing protein n=1 Tax=Nostocaceae TaxID=1162 RepID=UPI001689241E|nr:MULTISPECIES: DUF4079 domain-containing protein [Nostocaceae]MBD2456730.1 DUF4079 domain-containing protein [Nostoc sp. FACHB-87]MBD2478015.1 DUF4079 domain-containing protein [Anabaena sp. FACHB-83]
MINVSEALEPLAAWFRSLGIPQPIVEWGHPVMMGIVVLVMGSYVGWTGWRGRLAQDKDESFNNRMSHRLLAPWMFFFLAAGYPGGVLSLVMQHHPIFESPHFWTGSLVLILLLINSLLSLGGFGGDKPALRTTHAYLGSGILGLLVIHGVLGLI